MIRNTFIIITIIGLVALSWLAWSVFTERAPQFFPLNDTSATYTITKKCPAAQGNIESNFADDSYCLVYRGKNAFTLNDQQTDYFAVTVGKSNKQLEPFLDKNVVVTGEFVSSDKQCIENSCTYIGGAYVVVNIDSIRQATDN